MKKSLLSAALVFVLPWMSSTVRSQTELQKIQEAVMDCAAKVSPSCIAIRCIAVEIKSDENGKKIIAIDLWPSYGSGVAISEHAILTNAHVMKDIRIQGTECISGDGLHHEVTESKQDTEFDLAVLFVKEPLRPIAVAEGATPGQFVLAFGNPSGIASRHRGRTSISFGIVSAIGRKLDSKDSEYSYMIQTDAALNPGSSGGPLVNLSGQLLGINSTIVSRGGGADGIGFAIPYDKHTRKLVRRMINKTDYLHGFLGIAVDTQPADEGVRLAGIDKDSPAYRCGLRSGDVITQFDGDAPDTPQNLIRMAAMSDADMPLDITIDREGKSLCLSIIPSRRKD